MPKCLLLTGGAGFIGRHLCYELLTYGHRIRILDSLSEQVHGNNPLSLPPDVELVRGDIRDPGTMAAALRGIFLSDFFSDVKDKLAGVLGSHFLFSFLLLTSPAASAEAGSVNGESAACCKSASASTGLPLRSRNFPAT